VGGKILKKGIFPLGPSQENPEPVENLIGLQKNPKGNIPQYRTAHLKKS